MRLYVEVAKDFYLTLNELFSPDSDSCFSNKNLKIPPSIDLYLFGEGYGGKYVTAIANRILT